MPRAGRSGSAARSAIFFALNIRSLIHIHAAHAFIACLVYARPLDFSPSARARWSRFLAQLVCGTTNVACLVPTALRPSMGGRHRIRNKALRNETIRQKLAHVAPGIMPS